jgi:prepilin-type N-terminal cleavage/methylation domain-containing protein
MQHIRMSGRRARRGFTMVELLVALTLLGLVSAALYRVLVNNQRLYNAQTQRIDLSQNIRAVGNILPAEFRELDAADGDIAAMSPTSISIRAMRWLSFVCTAPLLAGLNNGLTMTIRGGQVGQPMFFGSRGLRTTDSLLVYLDGDPTTRNDDYFVPAQITAAPALTCPAVGAVGVQPGTQVAFNGNFIAGTNAAGAIPVGAPVWGFERVTYQLYQPVGDTSYYVGFQPQGGSMQPLIGPVLTNGLTFSYFDVNGNVTAVRSQVARIDITVRARTTGAIRAAGQAPAAPVIDSIATSVALRNNRRF